MLKKRHKNSIEEAESEKLQETLNWIEPLAVATYDKKKFSHTEVANT